MAAGGAWAAPAGAQTTGQARADILAQMQLQRIDDLRFGALLPEAAGAYQGNFNITVIDQ